MRALIAFLTFVLVAPLASADTALIISTTRYANAQNPLGMGQLRELEPRLQQAGFDVITVEDGISAALRNGLAQVLRADPGRVLIIIGGHFAHSESGTWAVATRANRPSLAAIAGQGISVEIAMEIAGRVPGQAVVLLATEERRLPLGAGLETGLGEIDPPQGVTVISGNPTQLRGLTEDTLLAPGADIGAALENREGLTSHGFLSAAVPFIPRANFPVLPVAPPQPSDADQALWDAVTELDTVAAYRAYLRDFPSGFYATQARERIDALLNDPVRVAEEAENALALNRNDRRRIQRQLTLLGFDTRGIDGIFGPGTRNAIRRWQQAAALPATGFMTRNAMNLLAQQAAIRAAEIEEEERLEREAQQRADRAFWQATGQGQTEDGLRLYLDRYPNGLFAQEARARLNQIIEDRAEAAAAQERDDWEEVRAADTIDAYEAYLARYPDGRFVAEARERIEELRRPQITPEIRQAQAEEAALNLPPVMRLMVERRLQGLGLETGRVDGEFDDNTRFAIARYQSQRGMPATGYLNQTTMLRLTAEALGQGLFE